MSEVIYIAVDPEIQKEAMENHLEYLRNHFDTAEWYLKEGILEQAERFYPNEEVTKQMRIDFNI